MDETKIREQVNKLIGICGASGPESSEEEFAHVLQGTTGIIGLLYGHDSMQWSAFQANVAGQKGAVQSAFYRGTIVQLALGVLRNILAELDAGLIGSIRQQAVAEVLTDFVALSRSALEAGGDQGKNVGAVLAAAAFEDTIRRLGVALGGADPREDLADILLKLKKSGTLQAPQVGIAQSYLNFRNHALHANWDSIQREAVHSVLAFVEQLVLKHFQ